MLNGPSIISHFIKLLTCFYSAVADETHKCKHDINRKNPSKKTNVGQLDTISLPPCSYVTEDNIIIHPVKGLPTTPATKTICKLAISDLDNWQNTHYTEYSLCCTLS